MTTSSGAFAILDRPAHRDGPGSVDGERSLLRTVVDGMLGSRETTTSTAGHDLAAARDRADLQAARTGENDAARRLLRRHGDGMRRTARRVLAGTADADDAVQDALVAALVTDALPRGDVGAWLRAVTARKAIDLCRRVSRRAESPAEEAPEGAASDDPALLERLLVHQALRHLGPTDRAVLVLMDLEGRSSAEIARSLGSTRAAVKVRAVRARRQLARLLRRLPGPASPPASKEPDDG